MSKPPTEPKQLIDKTNEEPGRVRVQIDFSPNAFAELARLQGEIDAPSRGETVRYALRTLQWLSKEIQADGSITLENADGSRTKVVFPFLNKVHQPS